MPIYFGDFCSAAASASPSTAWSCPHRTKKACSGIGVFKISRSTFCMRTKRLASETASGIWSPARSSSSSVRKPVGRGEAQKTRPHMPAAKNNEQRLRLEDLNENAEPSRARCSARGREVVMQECVLSCVQLRQCIRLCTPFGRSAANGSERMPVRVDQHFAAGARDAAGCFRDGHNGVRHARALRVQLRL